MLQASPSDIGHKELTPLLRPNSPGQICTRPSTNNTEPACHHNSFWGSRCDSNHTPTTSQKNTLYLFAAISAIISTQDTFYHTTYFITFNGHQVHFPVFSVIISLKSITFRLIPAKTNLSRLPTQKLISNQNLRSFQ